MNIEKAIEIKQRTGDELQNTTIADIYEADKLSIEALKRIVEKHEDDELLPGETK